MTTPGSTRLNRRSLVAGGARLGAGALLAGAAAGSLASRARAQAVTVEFPYLWTGPEGDAMHMIVDAYNQSQCAIAVAGVPNPDAQRQLAAMASSRGFDISDNFGSSVGSWASRGILAPLDEFIAGEGYDTADFVPAALEQMRYDGQLYALPIAVHTWQLLYNEDLLAAEGISEPPKTASEFADAIERLTKVDGSGAITQLGLYMDPGDLDPFLSLGYAFGGRWVDDAGLPTPADPGNVAALNFWVDHVVSRYGVDNVKRFQSGFGEYASPQNPFYTGKVAMVVDGEWQARFVQQYAPDLKWGAVSLPTADDRPELAGASEISTSMFFIPTNAQHKPEAWEFLKHVLSAGPMRDFTIALANLPARQSLLADAAYEEIAGFSYWLESLRGSNLRSFPNTTWSAEYRTELTSTLDQIANLRATPEAALTTLQDEATRLAQ